MVSDINSLLSFKSLTHCPFYYTDGTSYAFAALTLEDTEDPKVGDLGDELRNYEHLQHLYLKGNDIRSIESIAHLYHLLTVNCNTNSVSSIKFLEELSGDNTRLQFLQVSLTWSLFQFRNRFFHFYNSVSTSALTSSKSLVPSPSQDYPG